MFESLRKRNHASVQEKLAAVNVLNGLVEDCEELRGKEATLTRGLEQAEARRVAIPGEEQAIHDNHYRNIVQRELEPAKPDLTEQHNRMLADLATERAQLSGKIAAYGQELQAIQSSLAKLEGGYGGIERARQAMWSTIAEELIGQMPPDFQPRFVRLWSALDRVSNGISAMAVLSRIIPIELTTEAKMSALHELAREYGIADK